MRSFQAHWIVGRGLTMYRCQDFSRVPRTKRQAAVALQVGVWSPFADTGWRCVWAGGKAMVWFWDAAEVKVQGELLDKAALERPATVSQVPEPLFLPRGQDGARLVQCHDGYDLQFWQGGVLLDSLWTRQEPDARRVGWFLERIGETADEALLVENEMAPEPWSRSESPVEWLRARETAIGVTCLAVLALAGVWQEARYWKMRLATGGAAADLSVVETDVLPQLSARGDFVSLRRRNERLAELFGQPSQARLMGVVDEILPSDTAVFREWRFAEGELAVVLVEEADEAMDRVAFVRALEAHPWLSGVRAEQGRRQGEVRFRMEVAAR